MQVGKLYETIIEAMLHAMRGKTVIYVSSSKGNSDRAYSLVKAHCKLIPLTGGKNGVIAFGHSGGTIFFNYRPVYDYRKYVSLPGEIKLMEEPDDC